jgi:hypothetical protein
VAAGALTALAAGPASASASPQVINASLSSVSCPAANNCMAVGSFLGMIPGTSGFQTFPLAEHWNGSAWTVLPTPAPRHPGGGELLVSVSCTTGTSCMAVGQIQVEVPPGVTIQHPFAESWNGTKWRIVPTPKMAHTGATLNGVSCTSASDCMAVGDVGTPQNDTMFTLAERWNGTAWTVVGTPQTPGGTALNTVSCTSPGACMAAGFSNFNNGTGDSVSLAEQWNGAAWQRRATPSPGSGDVFGGVACTSPAACIAVGGHRTQNRNEVTLAEQWNGTGWQVLASPNPRGFGVAGMGGVSCPAAAACMGVGSWTDPTGESSFNLAEAWNGTSWAILRTPSPGSTNNELSGVSCTSPSSCMAVGDFIGLGNGMTLAESWNGTTWSVVMTPRP